MTDSPRHPSDPDWHPQVFPTEWKKEMRRRRLAEAQLPTPSASFEPYEAWVNAAFQHLFEAADTARDELERDRDFDWPGHPLSTSHPSPQGQTRQECIREAMRRFLVEVNNLQEG